uniref:Rrn7/TAF1B N-terminal cyclin domain-containing protein n=1 Tax=Paramoeba aestuarina TaxID=180227 RepID=A0A7S4P0W7_9EUKA|mmetsp:Transcript_34364/g.53646  ORF Transcript_34364/g.53646 Transcript_34364/m.53646 type:complete len:466 (+) Transcript_34364:1-1398(+)
MQVITFITKYGCSLELKDLVWAMWSQLLTKLEKYHHSPGLRDSIELKSISCGLLPKIELTLCLSYLALLITREPIPLHILVRHVKQGKIPYFTAFSELPMTTDHRYRLSPLSPIDLYSIESIASALRTFLFGREFLLPPIDFHGTTRIMLEDLQLVDLYDFVVALWEIDQSPGIQPLFPVSKNADRGAGHQVAVYIFIAFQLCFDLGRGGMWEEGGGGKRRKGDGPRFLEDLMSFEEWVVKFVKSEVFTASGPRPWGIDELIKGKGESGENVTQEYLDICNLYFNPVGVSKKHLNQGLKKIIELSERLSKETEDESTTGSFSSSSSCTMPTSSTSSPTSSSDIPSTSSSSLKRKREKFPFESILLYEPRTHSYHPRMNLGLSLFSIYIGFYPDPVRFYKTTNDILCRILHRLNQGNTKVPGATQFARTRKAWVKNLKLRNEIEWRTRLNQMAHRKGAEEEQELKQ